MWAAKGADRRFIGIDGLVSVSRGLGGRHGEQLAHPGQVLGAPAVGEQAVVANAVEARGEHVGEKASEELGYRQGHGLVQITVFGPVVLVVEGDLAVVEGDQAAV